MNMITVIMQSEISTSSPITLIASHLTEKKIKINKTKIENIPQGVATELSKAPH